MEKPVLSDPYSIKWHLMSPHEHNVYIIWCSAVIEACWHIIFPAYAMPFIPVYIDMAWYVLYPPIVQIQLLHMLHTPCFIFIGSILSSCLAGHMATIVWYFKGDVAENQSAKLISFFFVCLLKKLTYRCISCHVFQFMLMCRTVLFIFDIALPSWQT